MTGDLTSLSSSIHLLRLQSASPVGNLTFLSCFIQSSINHFWLVLIYSSVCSHYINNRTYFGTVNKIIPHWWACKKYIRILGVLLQLQRIIFCVILFSAECILICSLLFFQHSFLSLSILYSLTFSMASLMCLFTPVWLCVQQQVCVFWSCARWEGYAGWWVHLWPFPLPAAALRRTQLRWVCLDDSSFNVLNQSSEMTENRRHKSSTKHYRDPNVLVRFMLSRFYIRN